MYISFLVATYVDVNTYVNMRSRDSTSDRIRKVYESAIENKYLSELTSVSQF